MADHFQKSTMHNIQSVNPQSPAQTLQDSAADPVVAHIRRQLDPADCPAGEDDQGDDSLLGLNDLKTKSGLALKLIIGRRIVLAREMNGFSQGELAQALGFENSSQVSLWEHGRRLPPLHFIVFLSSTLAVSIDWLLGLDSQPERDSATAARGAVLRRMSAMLKSHAGAVADVLLAASRFDPVPELRNSQVVSKVASLCCAVDKFRDLNTELFDDARAGAMLLRTARDAREAVARMAELLAASDRRIEFALAQGRDALVLAGPEPRAPGGAMPTSSSAAFNRENRATSRTVAPR